MLAQTPIYVGQRRSGNNGQTTKPVTVRTLKPGTTLLTADVGGLQPANPQVARCQSILGLQLTYSFRAILANDARARLGTAPG